MRLIHSDEHEDFSNFFINYIKLEMNLIDEFKNSANKLKKSQRVVFKKQDTKEVSNLFNQLSLKFDKIPSLANYGGLCMLGVFKSCENSGDIEAQSALLKGARMFRKSSERKTMLGCINDNSNIEGSYRCYSQALCSEKDPVIKACIIREFNEINKNLIITSDFSSYTHRIYELEKASNENILSNDYIFALEKLTEIIEDFSERKCENLYSDVLIRVEFTRLLLLLILELPANHQSPSHIKILERFSWTTENFSSGIVSKHLSFLKFCDGNLILLFEMLVNLCKTRQYESIKEICDMISSHHIITTEQNILLANLIKLYCV
ncbi:uncharacterized protein Hap40 [Chironomus tepperi]|uniref:uncharacterized protein Hap40 n=1 Tax=Chironomus tepperi TaxID=113505 RepID=UPI00391F8B34